MKISHYFKSDKQRYLENGFIKDKMVGEVKPSIWFVIIMALIGVLFSIFFFKFVEALQSFWWIIFIVMPAVPFYVFVFMYITVRLIVDVKIAKFMAKAGKDTTNQTTYLAHHIKTSNDPIPIETIDVLPPGYLKQNSEKINYKNGSFNVPRTLYLWNFNTGSQYLRPCLRSWQKYGPVYLIPSPRFIPILSYFRMVFSNLETFFICDKNQLIKRLNQTDETQKKLDHTIFLENYILESICTMPMWLGRPHCYIC